MKRIARTNGLSQTKEKAVRNTASPDLETGTLFRKLIQLLKA